MRTVGRRLAGLFALIGVITALCSACRTASAKTLTLHQSDAGTTVALNPGDTLTVILEGNPTTGYRWEVASFDGAILEPQGEPEYEQAHTDRVGVGGEFTLQIRAQGTGTTSLDLIYHRPWEKDIAPLKTFAVNVEVK